MGVATNVGDEKRPDYTVGKRSLHCVTIVVFGAQRRWILVSELYSDPSECDSGLRSDSQRASASHATPALLRRNFHSRYVVLGRSTLTPLPSSTPLHGTHRLHTPPTVIPPPACCRLCRRHSYCWA